VSHHARIMIVDRFSSLCLLPPFYQDARRLVPLRLFEEDQSVHRLTAHENQWDRASDSCSVLIESPFPPCQFGYEQGFFHHICLAIQHPNSALLALVCFDLLRNCGGSIENCKIKATSPSFEVNISRKALSYSPRYPCINDLMGTNTGSVHES
jgi:hypothetical protein